jgi:hypothetical protein
MERLVASKLVGDSPIGIDSDTIGPIGLVR